MGSEVIALVSAITVAIITTGGNFLINRINRKDARTDEREKQDDLVRNAVMVMLHDRLYQACKGYIRDGQIDEAGYTNVTALYEAYHSMGGNGTGTRLYEQVSDIWQECLAEQ